MLATLMTINDNDKNSQLLEIRPSEPAVDAHKKCNWRITSVQYYLLIKAFLNFIYSCLPRESLVHYIFLSIHVTVEYLLVQAISIRKYNTSRSFILPTAFDNRGNIPIRRCIVIRSHMWFNWRINRQPGTSTSVHIPRMADVRNLRSLHSDILQHFLMLKLNATNSRYYL